jgi:UDP-glucose 4-epimerase
MGNADTDAGVLTWVVGGGGLLGSAIAARAARRFSGSMVPWGQPAAAQVALRADLGRFAVAVAGGPWAVHWVAGAAVTSADVTTTAIELAVFEDFVRALRSALPAGRGAVLVASSAGGVYAGSEATPPFDDRSPERPVSPYGELKLAQERSATSVLAEHSGVCIARLANLYGPGQDLRKRQGLVSQLCLATLLRRSLNLYVPLETSRDYLYVDDAARMAHHLLAARVWSEPSVSRHVLASGRAATVAELVALVQRLTKRRAPIAYGADSSARFQARDLRLRPSAELARLVRTGLPVGIMQVLLGIRRQVQAAGVPMT